MAIWKDIIPYYIIESLISGISDIITNYRNAVKLWNKILEGWHKFLQQGNCSLNMNVVAGMFVSRYWIWKHHYFGSKGQRCFCSEHI